MTIFFHTAHAFTYWDLIEKPRGNDKKSIEYQIPILTIFFLLHHSHQIPNTNTKHQIFF